VIDPYPGDVHIKNEHLSGEYSIFSTTEYDSTMIGKMKKWLGIEGVKLELIIPEVVPAKDGEVKGQIRFQSMNPQEVTGIRIVFIERYSRGRGKEKLTDEYELGRTEINKHIDIPSGTIQELDFTLPFKIVPSDFEEIGRRNPVAGSFVKVAKYISQVKSEYRIEAEAVVKGTALNPFDRKEINVR